MRNKLIFFLLMMPAVVLMAQSESVSKVGSLNIIKEVKPPILQVQGLVVFEDPSGNKTIDANEKCHIQMHVKNVGLGDGYSLTGKIKVKSGGNGITVHDIALPVIKVGATQTVEFPVEADMNTADGTAEFEVYIDEPNGYGTEPFTVKVPTRAFVSPMVEYRGYKLAEGAVSLSKAKIYTLSVYIQNTGRGTAEDVRVLLSLPDNVALVSTENDIQGIEMTPGQTRTINYKFVINQKYSSGKLKMNIDIDELYNRYSKGGQLSFDVIQQNGNEIVVESEPEPDYDPVQVFKLDNDVDNDIPQTSVDNSHTHVMIISNQGYRSEQPVTTANNDGMVMREYCIRTLGIPTKQVVFLKNRTYAEMRSDVNDFAKTISVNSGDKFMFFYFGHGMHDQNPASNDAYLIPVDGSSQRLQQTGLSRNWMMKQFENANPEQLVVYLESCFSGATSDDGMLEYAQGSSGLRLEDAVDNSFTGNIILITASSNSETASALYTHNVFTYVFLKELQSSRGQIEWGTLFNNVRDKTISMAWNELKRDQTPSVTVSKTLDDSWRKWSLMPKGRK